MLDLPWFNCFLQLTLALTGPMYQMKRLLLPVLFASLLTSATLLAQNPGNTVDMLHDHDVRITMRDGIELSLDIFRPSRASALPSLLVAVPYPIAVADSVPDHPATGPVNWWVERGFNVVLASVRGTGKSAGDFEFMGREEQQDLYETIEWIAEQDWSNTQVAGLGAGYAGTAQWFMGIQNPPHLACIAPVSAVLDPMRDWAWKGGLLNPDLLRWYETEVREPHAWPASGEPRFINFDLQRQLLEHRQGDTWWTMRRPAGYLAQVETPVFQSAAWLDEYRGWLGGMLRTTQRMPAGSRTYLGSTGNLLQDPSFLEQELLPFYQWCFGGKPASGVALLPAVRYQLVNSGQARASSAWPPANINYRPLYLFLDAGEGNMGTLLAEPDNGGRNRSNLDSVGQLVLKTGVLEQAVDLAGPLLLQLHASSSARDSAFQVELFEEEMRTDIPAGTFTIPGFLDPQLPPALSVLQASKEVLISSGLMRASLHNSIDTPAAASQANPLVDVGELLYPGRVYRFDLVLDPAAWRVKAGSRLVLKIRQTSDPSLRNMASTDTLYHSAQYSSRLWLPLSADSNLVFMQEPEVQLPDPALPDLFDSSNPMILLPAPSQD
jgi:uncharacterized protein